MRLVTFIATDDQARPVFERVAAFDLDGGLAFNRLEPSPSGVWYGSMGALCSADLVLRWMERDEWEVIKDREGGLPNKLYLPVF